MSEPTNDPDIAVIGLAGRFPGAPSADALWRLVAEGREGIRRFSDDELAEAGVPDALRAHPHYVPARAIVDRPEWFDAGLFGMSAVEARITDPQHRVFLETCWEALEEAALDPARPPGPIAVFAGADVNSYALGQLLVWTHDLQSLLGNDKDYLATRVAFKLDLRGPAVTVQTACSTSLVAIQLACQSLLSWQCDVALAGGVGLAFPQKVGYIYQEGGILSPDGHCRPFDAAGRGTVGGDGCGVVVLKRLEDALAAGDVIRAIIKGAAINNDGAAKIGFTAPSVIGQAEAIAMAQAMADVGPDSIGYVEAHGTATALGDPIEVAALDEVFKRGTDMRRFCALSALKSNVGHMNSAAGVGGFMKAVMAVERGLIPPVLHHEQPNAEIDFEDSCFFVNTHLSAWPIPGVRRAAVSSFGVGGTNAHVVLEQAPDRRPTDPLSSTLLVVSAHDADAAAEALTRLADHLESSGDSLPDIGWTLQVGRRALRVRAAVAAGEPSRASAAVRSAVPRRCPESPPRVALLFPGQGAQHQGALLGLHQEVPAFRAAFDDACDGLRPLIGVDLRRALDIGGPDLDETAVTQPLLFALGWAMHAAWSAVGVQPDALLGHSVGELVAAAVSGLWTFDDALRLVAARGRIVARAPRGAMLVVGMTEDRARSLPGVELAVVNAHELCVVAGTVEAIEATSTELAARGVYVKRNRSSHAFHTGMLDGVLAEWREVLGHTPRGRPRIPWVSNLTGTWIEEEDQHDPDYWVRQLRRPVRFADGVATLLATEGRILVDAGPGTGAGSLVRRHPRGAGRTVISSARHENDTSSDLTAFLQAVGDAWVAGAPVDLGAASFGTRRNRVRLPTYPFQRQRHWQDVAWTAPTTPGGESPRRTEPHRWFYAPGWATAPAVGGPAPGEGWRVVFDGPGVALARVLPEALAVELRDVTDDAAWDLVLADATHVVFCPAAEAPGTAAEGWLAAVRAASRRGGVEAIAVVRGTADPVGEKRSPDRCALLGLALVARQELGVVTRVIDADLGDPTLRDELLGGRDAHVALRAGRRFLPTRTALPADAPVDPSGLPERPVVLIPGGLGTVGMGLAAHLARTRRARLVLVRRAGLVSRDQWDTWLQTHRRDDPTSLRIERIRAMEAEGADVLVLSCDVTDPARTASALDQVQRTFGRVDLVIHAAGLAGRHSFKALADTTAEDLAAHRRPRLDGAHVLRRLLPGVPMVLAGSIATAAGGVGLGAYTAACAALDALAAPDTRVIGWDAWRSGTGGAVEAAALTEEEAGRVFDRAIALRGAPHVWISTVPLDARRAAASFSGDERRVTKSATIQPRPELDTPYVGPRDPLEALVVDIWKELFGLDKVGVHDNFFTLGGDSLLAIQLGTRLREAFGVDLPVQVLFEQPTPESVARKVKEALDAQHGGSDSALATVEGLSDDEVGRLLAELEGTDGR